MAKFKKGDVVELRSGGPNMTIKDFEYVIDNFENGSGHYLNDSYVTIWFEGGEIREHTFQEELLSFV